MFVRIGTLIAAAVTAAAQLIGADVARADTTSYVTCVTMHLDHLGAVTPPDGYVALGRSIDQNVHQNGASPQSQVNRLEGNGFSQPVAGAIVQCALVNSPI
ncbi:hypothetical protein [Mycobacterium malmoense]|uniref:hypothetical protein n=1 Tax=Mycobacterium malmoense TaxID=1780 RepID=UPI001146BEF0|nr:hypothetical protein [Mycobacterium malmoense]